MTKFSIIIPAYNVEEYITDCLNSISNQTYTDFEVICVDDCSTDNTYNKINDFVQKDSRFKLIKLKKNSKSASRPRNTALDAATGYYIVFIDPDDYIVPNALEKIYQAFTNSKADCIWYDSIVLDGDKIMPDFSIHKHHTLLKKEGFYNITSENISDFDDYVWDKAYKRSAINKLNFRFYEGLFFEDAESYFKIHTRIKKIYYLPDCLYVYRLRPSSFVRNGLNIKRDLRELDAFNIFRNMYLFAKENNIFEEYKSHLLKVLGQCILFYKYDDKYETVIKEANKVLKEINFPKDF